MESFKLDITYRTLIGLEKQNNYPVTTIDRLVNTRYSFIPPQHF